MTELQELVVQVKDDLENIHSTVDKIERIVNQLEQQIDGINEGAANVLKILERLEKV